MKRRWLWSLLAPLAAVLFALVVSGVLLWASGHNPFEAFSEMIRHGIFSDKQGFRVDSLISTINRAIPLYLSAIAVAIGFKMGLFNIGVEGQYKIAVLVAASLGAAVTLPPILHVPLIVITAMLVGALWSGIPGLLKVTRGVHEVISTIMMNFIATGLAAYLLATYFRRVNEPGELVIETNAIPGSGLVPSLNSWIAWIDQRLGFVDLDPGRQHLHGFLIAAIIVGVAYHYMVQRTRFGFELRASGINPGAAKASGVNPNAMVVKTMVISGAVAGLVGMSFLLGFFGKYTIDFPTMLGFDGIAVALLGRNHPVGMAFGALIFGWFNRSAQILDLRGIPKEIVQIMLGIVILSVVVAYAVVGRVIERREIAAAHAALEDKQVPAEIGLPDASAGEGGAS